MWYELYFNKTVIKTLFIKHCSISLRSSSSKVWHTFFLVSDWFMAPASFPTHLPLHFYGVCKLVWVFILWSARKLGQMDYIKLSYFWQTLLLDDIQNNPDGICLKKLNALANLFLILTPISAPLTSHTCTFFWSR